MHDGAPTGTTLRPAWQLSELELRMMIAQEVARALGKVEAAPTLPDRLTAAEAAELLRCSVRKVRQLIAEKTLRAVRLGRRTFVPRVEVERYLASL